MTESSPALENIVLLHAEDAAFLWDTRREAVRSPAVRLAALAEFDERLDANLDGLVLAGEIGGALCEAQLSDALAGELFAACAWALRTGADDRLWSWISLAEEAKADLSPVADALGWVDTRSSEAVVNALLTSPHLARQQVALRAMERLGFASLEPLVPIIRHPSPDVRAPALRALRWANPREALPILARALNDREPHCRVQAAASAVLLGDRGHALDVLEHECATGEPLPEEPLQVLAVASPTKRSRPVLQALMARPSSRLAVLRALPMTGDWHHLPWLVEHARDGAIAALVGLSFTALTGAQVVPVRKPHEAEEAEEPEAGAEPGEADLPVPDPFALQAWCDANARVSTHDARFLLGQPLTAQACEHTWLNAAQPFRAIAALHLAALRPGRTLLDASAPAWRQKQSLGSGTFPGDP